MSRLELYEPGMCCSTGVCGPTVDPELVRVASDIEWLKAQGIDVERYNLSQNPEHFAKNTTVRKALDVNGMDCLPLTLLDGEVIAQGKYMMRDEVASLLKLNGKSGGSHITEAVSELIALGAAFACNSESSFKFHYDRARKLGVTKEDILLTVQLAETVKEAPSENISKLATRYLQPELREQAGGLSCCGPQGPSGCC